MKGKIEYARSRWQCGLFYIDSNDPFKAEVFRRIASEYVDYPNVLLIPENESFAHYAYGAVYKDIRFEDVSVPQNVQRTYPNAFNVIKVENLQDTSKRAALVQALRLGSVLMVNMPSNDTEAAQSKADVENILNQANPSGNRSPVAGNTYIDTYVGTSEVKGLLGSDPDGDPLTFSIVNNARYGRSEIKRDTDGLFKLFYTSLNRFYGNDRVTYLVTDNHGNQSNVATVGINFINRAPVAQNNNIGVASGAPVSQYLFANDPDNDPISFRLVNNPLHGTGEVKLDAQGKWRVFYTSVPNYVGPDRITFIAIDDKGKESGIGTISINVVRTSSQGGSGGGS